MVLAFNWQKISEKIWYMLLANFLIYRPISMIFTNNMYRIQYNSMHESNARAI